MAGVLDRNIAQSMIVEDFLRKNIRKEKDFPAHLKPKQKESPWGRFPDTPGKFTPDGRREVVQQNLPRKQNNANSNVRGLPKTASHTQLMPESPIKHPLRPRSAAARPQNNQKKEPPRHQRQNFHVYGGAPPPPGGAPAAAAPADPGAAAARRAEEGEIRAFLNHTGRYRAHPRRLLEELAASQRLRTAGPGGGGGGGGGGSRARPRSAAAAATAGSGLAAARQARRASAAAGGGGAGGRGNQAAAAAAAAAARDRARTAFGLRGEAYERPRTAPTRGSRRPDPGPDKAGAYRYRPIEATLFRRYYDRGDLPVVVEHRAAGNSTRWTRDLYELDYHIYLPIFVDGLRERDDPYRFLAVQGTLDMVLVAPEKVLPVIPQIILPLKAALNTRHPVIICPALKVLQQMVLQNPLVGQALVPYYRQLLPVFNLYRARDENLGDGIAYNQRQRTNVAELIRETLEILEVHGGPDAFINIKYMIPTYESCML